MGCFNFSEFCVGEALHSHPPEHTVCYCLAKKKRGLFEKGFLSTSWKCCIYSHIDWASFLTCCTVRYTVHISPLGRSIPSGIVSTLAWLAHLCFRVQPAVYLWILSAFILPTVWAWNHWPQHQRWLPDTNPREQEHRLLRALRHCYFLTGQWYIQLLGCSPLSQWLMKGKWLQFQRHPSRVQKEW